MAFSFIHIADIHLGRAFSSICDYSFDETVKTIYKNADELAFNNFINFAIEKNVDFILIAGDTFDNIEQDFKSKLILKEGLKKLDIAGIKVYLICANHDPIPAYNKTTFNFDENSNIKIIGVNTQSNGSFIVEKHNIPIATIHAFSYSEPHLTQNPLKYFEPTQIDNKNLFHIGLLHCDLDADKSSPYAPISTGELLKLDYNYWALGHIHIPSNNQVINYSGTIQGRTPKETGAHGFKYIVVDNNSIIQNSFITTDIIRFENINVDISNASDITLAYEIIQNEIANFAQNSNCNSCKLYLLKLTLNGNIGFYTQITQDFYKTLVEKTKEFFNNTVYISDVINNTAPKAETELLQEDDGISGEIYRTINEKNLINAITKAQEEFKSLINQCNFSQSELIDFTEKIENTVKAKCLNLANQVYYNEERTEL